MKRETDVKTKLVLAASMVSPRYVYVKPRQEVYEPVGGREALIDVIDRYNKDDVMKQVDALNRAKSGALYASRKAHYAAENKSSDHFWCMCYGIESVGCEVFRLVINRFCGQGESERMNKHVKKFRSVTRNRQEHATTGAYMELDTIYRLIAMREKGPTVKPYLDCLRDRLKDIAEDVADLTAEQDEENERIADDAAQGEEENEDANDEEYNADAPDLGCDALIELLAAAAMLDEGDD